MKYTLIVQGPLSLPYAIDADGGTLSDAVKAVTASNADVSLFTVQFAIDHELNKFFRVIRDKDNLPVLTDSAYQQVGIQTPDSYFETAELDTAEIKA